MASIPLETPVETATEGYLVMVSVSTSLLSEAEWSLIQFLFPRSRKWLGCRQRVRLDANGLVLGHQSDLSSRAPASRTPRSTSYLHQLSITQLSAQVMVAATTRLKEGFTGHLLTRSFAGPVRVSKIQALYDRRHNKISDNPKEMTRNQLARIVLEPRHAWFKTFFCDTYIPGSVGIASCSSRFLVVDNDRPAFIGVVREIKRGWSKLSEHRT